MLRENIGMSKCESIISYPFVRLKDDGKTFQEFAEYCAKTVGGTEEEWSKKNSKLLGMFGTKNKRLKKNTRFQIPTSLVNEARDRFIETVGITKDTKKFLDASPTSVAFYTSSARTSSPDTSPEDLKKNKNVVYDV
jgi:hypothetical protein